MNLINQSVLTENDEQENDGSCSVKDYLQLNGGTTGLTEIKAAIENFKTPSKPVLGKHQC